MSKSTTARRAPLSRERVLRPAIAFADEHGVEALSMRKLADGLGVEAMSLYNHGTILFQPPLDTNRSLTPISRSEGFRAGPFTLGGSALVPPMSTMIENLWVRLSIS
jgi:hypothetical protein